MIVKTVEHVLNKTSWMNPHTWELDFNTADSKPWCAKRTAWSIAHTSEHMASSCAARSSRASLSRGYCNKNVILSTKPSSLSVKGFDCETWHHICFVSRSPNNNRKKKGSQDHQVRLLSLELKSGFTTLEMVGISTRDMLGWWKNPRFFQTMYCTSTESVDEFFVHELNHEFLCKTM